MKLSVKCEVESDAILPRELEVKAGPHTFCFEVDKEGRWNAIGVMAEIADPTRVRWGLEPVPEPRSPSQAPWKVVGDFGGEPYQSVINELQCLESTMSVFFPVRGVNWRYPTVSVIFEDGDQQDPTWGDLQSVRVSRQRPSGIKAEEKQFVAMVDLALNSQSLVVIESFWREGEREWVSGKFINAFFNFYFVLEGLYGNRKTKNYQIEQAFLTSTELKASIEKFLMDQHPLQHLGQVIKMVNVGERLPTSVELIKLLVSIRGRLHHFQNNPERPQGSPLAHHDYEGIAYLGRCLAHKGIVVRAVKVQPVAFAERRL